MISGELRLFLCCWKHGCGKRLPKKRLWAEDKQRHCVNASKTLPSLGQAAGYVPAFPPEVQGDQLPHLELPPASHGVFKLSPGLLPPFFWLGCVRRSCPALPRAGRCAAAPPALFTAGTRRSGKLQPPKALGALLLGQSPVLGACGCVGWALGASMWGERRELRRLPLCCRNPELCSAASSSDPLGIKQGASSVLLSRVGVSVPLPRGAEVLLLAPSQARLLCPCPPRCALLSPFPP